MFLVDLTADAGVYKQFFEGQNTFYKKQEFLPLATRGYFD